jgi:endonuclease YncB( thermonuclease family)
VPRRQPALWAVPGPALLLGRVLAAGILAAGVLAAGLPASVAWAHPGALDEYGGHFDERTGLYHYHRPSKDIAARKQEFLEWVRFPIHGIVKGVVASVDGSATIWLHMEYRPAYQELIQQVALPNRDDRKMLVRVDLAHVSPQETAARNPRFEDWFRKKVEYELKQKLLDKPVTVNFDVVGGSLGRLRGMVFLGEDNVNLWMVLNGWSYYVLTDGDNPYDKLFRNAEDIARRDKAGIWEHIR